MMTEESELGFADGFHLRYIGSESPPDSSYSLSSFLAIVQVGEFKGKVEFEITSDYSDFVSEQLNLFCGSFFNVSEDQPAKMEFLPEMKCGYGDNVSILLKFHKDEDNGGVQIECLIKDDFTSKPLTEGGNCNSLFLRFTTELQQVKEFRLFLRRIYELKEPVSFTLRAK